MIAINSAPNAPCELSLVSGPMRLSQVLRSAVNDWVNNIGITRGERIGGRDEGGVGLNQRGLSVVQRMPTSTFNSPPDVGPIIILSGLPVVQARVLMMGQHVRMGCGMVG